MTQKRALRRIRTGFILLLAVAGVLFVAAGWYFSGQIASSALAVEASAPTYDVRVAGLTEDHVTLDDSIDNKSALRQDMVYGLRWENGAGIVSGHPVVRGIEVTRRFELTEGQAPEVGDHVELTRDLVGLPGTGPDVRFTEVHYASGSAQLPAWFAEGDSDTWAVLVHGKGESPSEMARMASAMSGLGMPSLLISYRNDPGAPQDQDRRYGYGQSEWVDLQAAVAYAQAHGARHVVLGGASMGGAVVAAYLEESRLPTGLVRGVVLDAPMLDLASTVEWGATQRKLPLGLPLPGALTWTAERIAASRYDVDWAAVNYLDSTDWLDVPTLVIHGTDDKTVPVTTTRQLSASEPDLVTVREYKGAGHVESFNTDPAQYTDDVTTFLRTLS